jgi:acetyl-CoA carboxylase biotin carboxyl carrier protein
MDTQKKMSWLDRIEDIINVLDGSTIGELELTEGDTEIIIKRHPGMIMSTAPLTSDKGAGGGRASRGDTTQPVLSPMTGVYYASASPTSSSFVNVGEVIHVGQVVALVEAMKVFNEITTEIAGRVVAIIATSGNVVQKGDVLLRVEPL